MLSTSSSDDAGGANETQILQTNPDPNIVRGLRENIEGILTGIQTKLDTKAQIPLGEFPGTVYPLHSERKFEKTKAKLATNTVFTRYKSDVLEAVLAGLILTISTDDYSNLDGIPISLRSGATNLLLKLLPTILPVGNVRRKELDASGVTYELLRRSTRNYPTYLISKLISAF